MCDWLVSNIPTKHISVFSVKIITWSDAEHMRVLFCLHFSNLACPQLSFYRSWIILQSLNHYPSSLLQYSLFPRLLFLLEMGFSLFCLLLLFSLTLSLSPFYRSLGLTMTWIGFVQTTPSHWTSYSYTHVDTHKTTQDILCMVQWFSSSATPDVHCLTDAQPVLTCTNEQELPNYCINTSDLTTLRTSA